jgi:hypothetical protein
MKKLKTRPSIPSDVKLRLWTASAGRCEFEGCNINLWRNDLTMDQMNKAYIAHIYAYAKNGSRYNSTLSPQLETDLTNLMLLCDTCHRLVDDKKKENEYPASRLIKMKKDHEERIQFLTGIQPEKRSHIILYGSKVGEHNSPLQFDNAVKAMLPKYYPATHQPIELSLSNSSFDDSSEFYWSVESENLSNLFKQKVAFIKEQHEVQHYSIFGLAPQPLLIKLGTLLNDIYKARLYQLHREPSTWKWLDDDNVRHNISSPEGSGKCVALKFELSATISNDRITYILGPNVDIWSLTTSTPHNDYLRSKAQLKDFRIKMRLLFDQIKARHGQNAQLHIFPAMPVATAVELGRVWMPKADLSMIVYDQNWKKGGFFKALEIKNS